MGPLWFVRMARLVRRPPSWQRVMIILSVCGLAAAIIGAEYVLGLDLPERDFNMRRGPAIEVAN